MTFADSGRKGRMLLDKLHQVTQGRLTDAVFSQIVFPQWYCDNAFGNAVPFESLLSLIDRLLVMEF